jgi:hypothetical protein
MGRGCIDPHFLRLSTSWRRVVNFTPRPLYPQGKSPRYPLDRRLGGPQSAVWKMWRKETGRCLALVISSSSFIRPFRRHLTMSSTSSISSSSCVQTETRNQSWSVHGETVSNGNEATVTPRSVVLSFRITEASEKLPTVHGEVSCCQQELKVCDDGTLVSGHYPSSFLYLQTPF